MTSNNTTPQYVITNGSVAKQVTDILTKQIIEGKYQIGDYLPTEEELCHEFGIGRSSVREAIKTLESRGMVRKHQGKGVVIIDECIDATSKMLRIALEYKKTSLKDLMDFRVALEVKNVELAAINATDNDIEQMRKYLNLMQSENYSNDNFARHDYHFHEAIAQASNNSVTSIIIKILRPILYNQIIYTLNPNFNPELANHFHEKIFDAIENRQPKRAVVAMLEHLSETQRIITEFENGDKKFISTL